MTASLLNLHAINGAPRYTFAGSATDSDAIASGAGVRVAGFKVGLNCEAAATVSGFAYRSLQVKATSEAIIPPTDGWRILKVSAEPLVSASTASASAFKSAGMAFDAKAKSQAAASSDRIAYAVSGRHSRQSSTLNDVALNGSAHWYSSAVSADARLESTVIQATLIPIALHSEAAAAAIAHPDVTQLMELGPVNGRAIAYAHESYVRKIDVRRVDAFVSAISRASARATANEIFGYSYPQITSSAIADNLIARDTGRSFGVAQSLLDAAVRLNRDSLLFADGTAGAHADLSISSGGASQKFGTVTTAAVSIASSISAARWPMRGGSAVAYSLGKAETIRDRYFKANAYPESIVSSESRSNQWQRASGSDASEAQAQISEQVVLRKASVNAESLSEALSVPWHWVAQNALSLTESHSDAVATPVRNAFVKPDCSVEPVLSAAIQRTAFMYGQASSESGVVGEALAGISRYPSLKAANSASQITAIINRITYAPITASAESKGDMAGKNASVDITPAPVHASSDVSVSARITTVWADLVGIFVECNTELAWADSAGAAGARHGRAIRANDGYIGSFESQLNSFAINGFASGVAPNLAVNAALVSPSYFKINADKPAPEFRTIPVRLQPRVFDLQAQDREYRIR